MSLDPVSILVGFAIASVVQRAMDRAFYKIMARILAHSAGKDKVHKAFPEVLASLDDKGDAK